ncbi:LysR family transcriptional regulator [Erwinia typographi]|uniref:LysR family transcriptional regulator n=1 Tax=Erwinia typographi TaxID=371042 RepID=A0A0A4A1Q3_9GAMM|nr:LysR family transcriptional regulator [Erwinia typographi]
MSLEALRTFVAIRETGSFRRAAARVSLSPSAVSLQIAKLEEMLGHRLLERNARKVTLTVHGDVLLQQAQSLLTLNEETLAMFCGSSLEGRLVLAAPYDLGMVFVPELLRRMAERYPRICIDVRLGVSSAMLKAFSAGQSNILFFNDSDPPAIPSLKVWSEPLVWLMARGGRALFCNPLPLAVAASGCAWREAALGALNAAGRSYRIAYSSDAPSGQAAALRADLAVAALPVSMEDSELMQVPQTAGLPELPQSHVRVACDEGELAAAVISIAQEVARAKPALQ